MRVLVTGAAGFVGHHLVEHVLRTTDWEVVGVASFQHRGCPLRLKHLEQNRRFTLAKMDLSAPIAARVASSIGPIDAIVNMAAESHVDRSIETPRPFVLNNVEVALTVFDAAREFWPGAHVLHFSTDEVYGAAPVGYAHREWDAILPSNPYSASKAAQEAIATSYWRTYGLRLTMVNSMNLIGERQDREKFLPMLIRGVANDNRVVIHGSPGAIGSRMYLHARNLASGICWLLDPSRPPTGYADRSNVDRPDRYHIVGEREVDNLELAQMVAAIMDKPLRYRLMDFHQARPGHDRRYALDATKIREAGWQQPVDFVESLERTVRWTVDHSEWMV